MIFSRGLFIVVLVLFCVDGLAGVSFCSQAHLGGQNFHWGFPPKALTLKFQNFLVKGSSIPSRETILRHLDLLRSEANVLSRDMAENLKLDTLSIDRDVFLEWSSHFELRINKEEIWRQVNDTLRSGEALSESQSAFYNRMLGTLSHIPAVRMTTFRSIEFPLGMAGSLFKAGDVFEDPGFFSASLSLVDSYMRLASADVEPVVFVLNGYSGKPIFPFVHQSYNKELEILFAPRTRWRVDAVFGSRAPERYPNVIVMTELSEQLSASTIRPSIRIYPIRGILQRPVVTQPGPLFF